MSSTQGDIVVLSDLHLGRGKNPDSGRYYTLEAFFYDDDFLQFCRYLTADSRARGVPLTVVFNGDTFDLLRIEPEATNDATKRERRYGAVHTPTLAARMVAQILRGHPNFVRGVAHLLAQGCKVVLLPGNHDIEVQWEEVREVIRAALREVLSQTFSGNALDDVMARFCPLPWFYYEPGRIWIEHGCQYDSDNAFRYLLRGRLSGADERIFESEQDLPLGNFFQRYLYNAFGHITFIVPSARANLRYMKWLLVNQPRILASVLTSHLPFALQVLRRIAKGSAPAPLRDSHTQELDALASSSGLGDKLHAIDKLKEIQADVIQATRTLGWQLFKAGLVIVMVALASLGTWFVGFQVINELRAGMGLKSLLFLTLNFVMALIAGGTLTYSLLRNDPVPARPFARAAERIADLVGVPIVTFGHTHDEVVSRVGLRGDRAWYFNTGTWIAVFTHDVLMPRERVQYTFLRVREQKGELLQWSPGRGEPMQVILLDENVPDAWGVAAPAPAITPESVPAPAKREAS